MEGVDVCYSHFDAAGLPIAIPDADPAGIESSIDVAGMAPTGCGVTTSLTITHSWRGDLRVALTRPDGTEIILHDRTGSSADDLIIIDEVVSAGGPAEGEWILHVSDNATADEGTLESWSLTVDCS